MLHPSRLIGIAAALAGALASFPLDARELSTDRPDQTESPYTVPRGRWQAEFQVASAGRDPGADRWSHQIVGVNVKRGLANDLDLQLVFPGLESVPDGADRTSGIGDLALRLKWNLFGNDGPGSAVAVMPFVNLPTGHESFRAGGWEGGLIVPAAFTLPGDTGLGLMVQGDILRDADGEGTHGEGFVTATVGHDLTGPLGGFAEVAARFRPAAEGDDPWSLDLGLTLGPTEDTQLDAGVQIGLSDGAEDLRVFAGYTLRR